jgi:CHAD domain-containing protein
VIGLLVAQARWHEPGTRIGVLSEPLHQMRVTTRRLRAALRIFADAAGRAASGGLRSELAELADGLGAVRDLDVYLQDLPAMAQRIGGVDRPAIRLYRQFLLRRRQRARDGLRRMLDSPRYGRLLSRLDQAARPDQAAPAAPADAPDADVPVTQYARRVIRLYRGQLLRYARAILVTPSDAQLHRLRLRIKRLRYTCEFLQSLYGDGKLTRFIRKLVELQDSLGCFQDAIVQAHMLEGFAADLPAADPAVASMRHDLDQLIGWQRKRQQRCCRAFFRQWRRYDAKWISRPLKKVLAKP